MKRSKLIKNVLGFLIIAVMFAIFNTESHTSGISLATVVIGGSITTETALFRENLERKVTKLSWVYSRMSQFMSFIDMKKYKEAGQFSAKSGKQPVESFIHVTQSLDKGGIISEVPIRRPVVEDGVYGSANISGTGEHRTWFTKKVAVNQVAKAVIPQTSAMDKQVLTQELADELLEKGTADIQDWFTRFIDFQPYFAILTGYSKNLTHPTNGINKTQKSHPNFYVQGYGDIAFGTSSGAHVAYTFDAGWEANIATGLATLIEGNTDAYFSLASIKNMVFLAGQKKIPKMKIKGQELYLIFIHSAQMKQLREDPNWVNYMKDAAARGDINQLFTGISEGYAIEGGYLIVDDTIPAIRNSGDTGYDSTTGGTNQYGYHISGKPQYLAEPRDTGAKKPAILVGQGAVTASCPSRLKLSQEVSNHGQFIEDAGTMIFGFERADIIDDDGFVRTAGLLLENSSSLVYVTYSPDTITI